MEVSMVMCEGCVDGDGGGVSGGCSGWRCQW